MAEVRVLKHLNNRILERRQLKVQVRSLPLSLSTDDPHVSHSRLYADRARG